MVNYACAFSQSESGKYFERIIMTVKISRKFYLPFVLALTFAKQLQATRRVCNEYSQCFPTALPKMHFIVFRKLLGILGPSLCKIWGHLKI